MSNRIRSALPQRGSRLLLLAALAVAGPLAAQQPVKSAFDRSVVPPAGKLPELRVPTWTTTTLSNGAKLIVSERHTLPLVSFSITWVGGGNQYVAADRWGLAGMLGSMLTEGTTHRTGDQLANDLLALGTSINTSVGGESAYMGFLALTDRLEPTLAILEDMLVNPTFPAEALERLRARTLVQLAQARDRTSAVAQRVFPGVVYSEAHPYGRVPTEATIKAITREDVVAFHKAFFTPAHAIITVVGDVNPAAVRALIERVLAPWTATGPAPSFAYPAVPAAAPTTIYLVDKPGAAQSSFAIGLAGPPRDTPDYFALQVLNTILGGQFQSRLNADIREQKGYSYGVSSSFAFGKGPGPFRAGGDIITTKTASALIEFVKHLRGIGGAIPVTEEELRTAQDNLVQGLPERFGSVGGVADALTSLQLEALPADYYQTFAQHVRVVTAADVQRAAQRYIDGGHLAIVIVGDRKTIEEPLRATAIGPIVMLDVEGKPIR
ncbi:MAG: insulinase family protein [Gemmatimonadetes bacterium]|nr:insulinase family protein [Gemmatimonadota bacterium]